MKKTSNFARYKKIIIKILINCGGLVVRRLNFSKQPSSTVTSATTTTTTAAAATSGVLANVKPTRRNASASVARAVALTKATTRKSRKPAAKPAAAEAPAVSGDDIALDDRMREKQPYQGAKILETEYFQNMRYSFQRVPVNEPWYSTFQRQDEHRERVFEYWGNTSKPERISAELLPRGRVLTISSFSQLERRLSKVAV